MTVMDRFRSWLARGAIKGAGISFVPRFLRESFFFPSFHRLIQHGYKGNSAVFACTSTLALAFTEPPLVVWREGEQGAERVLSHPARRLIRRPNPSMGEATLMQFAITYAAIGGNCYLWKQRNGAGRTIALWPFHDGVIEPIPGRSTEEGWVSHYEFDPGDGRVTVLPREDVIHWRWMVDPEQPWRGIGAIAAVAREVGTDSEASDYVYSLLKNNTVPPVVVTLVEGEPFDQDRVRRLREAWMDAYGGANRGAPAFLEAGMTAETLGFNLEQLAFEALRSVPEARIAASFRVPPIIAGLTVGLERSTFANYSEARRAFAEDTLSPLWRSLASELSGSLGAEYGDDIELAFDLDRVKALRENQADLWGRANSAWQSGLARRSEARSMVGLEAGSEDDIYIADLVSAGVADLSGGDKGVAALARQQDTPALETKASRAQWAFGQDVVDALRAIRLTTAGRMEAAVEDHFQNLSQRMIGRLAQNRRRFKAALQPETKLDAGDVDTLLNLLFQQQDKEELKTLIERFFIRVVQESYGILDLALEEAIAFDLTDPDVVAILEMAGDRVNSITATTRNALASALQEAAELGIGIDDIVNGTPDFRGIRGIVSETYQNRARVIARTELGMAQNAAATSRYERFGVRRVLVFDNGLTDDDQPCKDADGSIWTLAKAKAHPLEHPNCTRAFAPLID